MKKTNALILTSIAILAILMFQSCTEKIPESKNKLVIDLEQKGDTISPYIYGQFIEHLGNCIYGGIWAEMVRDRKFYHPVTEVYAPYDTAEDPFWSSGKFRVLAASPWEIIGRKGSLKMDKKSPFTGQHAPEITLTDQENGIRQYEFSIVEGKDYAGYIYLSATRDATVSVALSYSDSSDQEIIKINDLTAEYVKYDFTFKGNQNDENASLKITGTGNGSFKIGTLSIMPTDNIDGFRPDVLALLKELDAPVYRWPGGNFVSGYNWKDGVGDRDKRPPRKNPAWNGVEPNDVGIHEFMHLCKLINTEPYIAVNTGLGTVDEVAEQVAYCNGDASSEMGKWRAENGSQEPFNIKWWAVGNEMYGDWQLGHMPLEEYVKKHNKVAEAMWKQDKDIQLIGVGHAGEWSETMLKYCSDNMNLISEHIYCRENKDLRQHILSIAEEIRKVSEQHRKYLEEIEGLEEKNIKIAMDEWNYWYGQYVYGELGVRYHLKDALGLAVGFHEYFRNSDLYFMANYAQTVNVIGAIKATPTETEFASTGLVLKLFRNHFGDIPVSITSNNDSLLVSAAISSDKDMLTVSLVNPTDSELDYNLSATEVNLNTPVTIYEITGDDPEDYNEPGSDRKVDLTSSEIKNAAYIKTKPYSITVLEIPL